MASIYRLFPCFLGSSKWGSSSVMGVVGPFVAQDEGLGVVSLHRHGQGEGGGHLSGAGALQGELREWLVSGFLVCSLGAGWGRMEVAVPWGAVGGRVAVVVGVLVRRGPRGWCWACQAPPLFLSTAYPPPGDLSFCLPWPCWGLGLPPDSRQGSFP